MAVKVQTKSETKPKEEPTIIDSVFDDSPPEEFKGFEEEEHFELLKPRDMPPFPAKNIEANKVHLFFEWQEKLVEDDWNHLAMYLFREWPIIDRTRVNPKANINIEIIVAPFDIRSKKFLESHGSGKYKLLVNDSNKAIKGKGGTLGTVRFQVDDPDYPPVFVLEELVPEHPSNRTITDKLVAEGKLTIEGKVMQTQQGGNDNAAMLALVTRLIEKLTNQPNQPKDTTAESISKMYVDANSTMMGMVKDQIKSDDPEKLVKMLAALKEMMPKHESENTSLALIVKMQGDMAKVQADSQVAREGLMLKMMEMMNAKSSGEDQEDKILARIATYKELFGGDGGGRTRNPSIPELLIEHGAPVVLKVLETIQGFVNIRNYQAGLAKQQAGTQPNPQAQTQPQAIPAATEEPKKENVVEMQSPEAQLKQVIQMAGGSILSALQRGIDGSAFADSIAIQHGQLAYDQIASAGKEKILEAMKSVPEFWNQVVPSSIEKFVDEFLEYGKDDGEAGVE